jgi:hypothetical protein
MKRRTVKKHIDFQDATSPRSPDEISLEIPDRAEVEKTVVETAQIVSKSRQIDFNPNWHDAKEIVVPFDESSFSGLLVDEKTFQAAYSRNRPPPLVENHKLEIQRSSGNVVFTTDWWDDLMGFCSGLLFFVEIVLAVWTAALLYSGFPIAMWLAYTLESVWALMLITFKFSMAKLTAYRLFLWCGTCATTVSWLVWSPWSQDFIAKFSAYFFRT